MSEQKQAFRPMADRKIILATNIAETSITIEDVVYVIDGGKVKEKSMDPGSGTCQLRSQWVSKVNALKISIKFTNINMVVNILGLCQTKTWTCWSSAARTVLSYLLSTKIPVVPRTCYS